MRPLLALLFLAAQLFGGADAVRAQDSQSADQERKARIENLFADAARYREAQRYELCLDSLDAIIKLANIRDGFNQRNEAALYRASNEVVALRSLISGQVQAQVQVVRNLALGIERTADKFWQVADTIGISERPDQNRDLAKVSANVDRTRAFLREHAFARDRVAALAGAKRNRESVTRLAEQVCRARSRDAIGSAVDDIEVARRQALDVEQRAEGWQDERFGRPPDSPVSAEQMIWVANRLNELEGYTILLESKIAECEKSRAQTLQDLERAIATLRPQVEPLGREQQKLETLLTVYRRSGEVVKFGEDLTSSWRQSAPSDGPQVARGHIATLEKTLLRLQRWDAAKAHASARQTRADLERLVAQSNEVNKIVADTDAAAQAVRDAVVEIGRERDRARACFDSIDQRAASPAPAAPAQPTPPPAVAPAVAATPQKADSAGAGKPQAPTPQPKAPAQAPVPTAQVLPATTPAIDPNVAGGIKIQGPTTRILVGQRVQFVATDYGNRPYAKVTWNSFDEELLSLDSQGWATGLKPGALLIHAQLDDSRDATLSVEVVARPGAATAPAQPAAPATTPAPPQPSGFQAGATTAGPANLPSPAKTSPSVTTTPDSNRAGTSLLGIDAQAAPKPPAKPGTQGFEVGATTAGPDPSQPPSRGGGPPGGGGGQNPQRGPQQPGPQQTRAVAGQPAAYHIFAAGSRLGWASGLGQYSIGPADRSIIEHLQVAGEHVMWANRESYLPVKAWPNWTANRAEIRSWADELARDPRNPTRRQIPIRANSLTSTLADQLRTQTMGTPEHVATCDAAYMSLGYELGYAQQTLAIAVEAAQNGDAALAQRARQDGMSHLQTANRILSEYEGTQHLTGRCADLRDVRTQIDTIIRSDARDMARQSTATAAAWTLALERIVALRGGQQTQTTPTLPTTTSAVAGQPAAYHIFAAGSRLGWASGLGQYSIGPADRSIIEHLQVAGEHVMWANRESYLPVKAWPNWTANRAEIRSWADELARDPRNPTRRQIPIRANSLTSTLADQLRTQTMGTPEHVATCDAAYMSLGYELAYAQQTLAIAVEAAQNGDAALAQRARQDGMSHLQTANRILSEYEGTQHLTGRCADLRDVRTQIDTIIRSDARDMARQSTAAAAAWKLALERIAALRAGQQTQVIQTPPPPASSRTGGGQQPAATPAQASGADPGELEGYWVNGGRIYRFVKQGDEYIGSIEHSEEGNAEFGIREGVEVYRLKRLGPNLYRGTYHMRRAPTRSSSPPYAMSVDRQEPVWVSVLGIVAFGWGPGASTAYLSPVFNIRPPRDVAETWLGAPDYYESLGLIRVQNQSGNWTIPNERRVRLLGGDRDPSNAYWSNLLFPSTFGRGKPFWFIASGKNPDGKPVFIVFPDYDRAVAGGMNPEGDPRVTWGPTTRDDYRIDSLSREYLTRGGFSIIFGPANVSDITVELGRYPQDVTDVRR